ncbi:ATP-dependent DNA helicase mph1 [Emericellopsis atlantica]|uniref:ATP-dependent DNA helicase n=1 Tax=Emericellopsis atlantica TaxID=2614577 RepID=A0A9P7ZDE4_9HYPO|nr:ATP-dependent DNA helicase mph1 [Emericellopsis atlantica]KAG9249515.1 ATP-dependent DNA helicase mph1 [Emericellopsis atlantica]
MDSDEFDDGLADEDLVAALERSSQPRIALSSGTEVNDLTKVAHRRPQKENRDYFHDLPSDAFFSPESSPRVHEVQVQQEKASTTFRNGLSRSSSGNFRQTTLFGSEASSEALRATPSQPANRAFRADLPREEPTHHAINREAMRTWVYPTNLGAIRDYQFSIVKNSLFNNTLVALPTGLGKTFIAATVMLNYYRWTKDAKIVFVAPTKPLVAQQVDACYNIAGIPRSETTLLTGDIPPVLRVDEWKEKRVFFMTPQTLLNDISHGYADPKSIVLLVIDEAHRATGEYAYAKVTKKIRCFSKSMRVLALTATPGSKVETVQEVIDNLGISHCEIRTENSIDIRQYVHSRNIEQVVLDPSYEMTHVSELFVKALKPLTEKLTAQNIWYGRNPMALTSFGLMQAQKEWFAARGRSANQGVQFMMRAVFSVLTGIAHSIKLFNFHGIRPFYDNLKDMRSEQEDRGEKGSKYKRQLVEDKNFQEMMSTIEKWLRTDGFVSHPKLTALSEHVLNHFMDNGETTRVIVFSEYRDSAEDVVRTLNKHRPLIRARVFVGQADGKRGEGMKQAEQINAIKKFKDGEFNVLVATSIGEEGLDIGQVDLIVCYDSSASPIRMLQRMGRTGRKRAGNIVLLLMRGKEEEQFAKSKDNYEKMQTLICEGSRFNFRFDLSTRFVPRDIRPEVDKRHVDIPVENTQDPSLPEPKKRKVPLGKKKPPKKFHMPDGVETGFKKLSDFVRPNGSTVKKTAKKANLELEDLASNPDLSRVVLTDAQLKELNRTYRDLPFHQDAVEEASLPSMTSHPQLQRELRPTCRLGHGHLTKACVSLLQKMAEPGNLARWRDGHDTSNFRELPVKDFVDSSDEDLPEIVSATSVRRAAGATRAPKRTASDASGLRAKRRKTPANAGKKNKDEDSENEGLTRRIRKSKAKGKKKKAVSNRAGINSDEIGDDCERESDMMDTDGSDKGEDLEDFVVSDNEVPSSHPEPESPLLATKKRGRAKEVRSPDTDVSDLKELVSPVARDAAAAKRNGRSRRVIDSDEDD